MWYHLEHVAMDVNHHVVYLFCLWLLLLLGAKIKGGYTNPKMAKISEVPYGRIQSYVVPQGFAHLRQQRSNRERIIKILIVVCRSWLYFRTVVR